MTDTSPPPAEQVVNVTALFAEAATKSGLLWVQIPGDRAWAVWHAWHEGRVLVVSGPGEQHLPWLPPEVVLVLRSKDTGGRLLSVSGRVEDLTPGTAEWEAAVGVLRPLRLNAPAGTEERWARECVIRAMTPYGAALEAPGSMADDDGRRPVRPEATATTTWRPWHLRGRPQRRRRRRS